MSLTPRPSTEDRRAVGLAARKQLPRGAHTRLAVARTSPFALLRAAERDRLPALLPLKHQRMAAGPFGYFRGAVPIMAADLAAQPNTGLYATLCGDAHVANLGAFCAPEGSNLVFDINDFDESLPGPFEFDLKRLATSLLLAAREAGVRRGPRQDAVLHFSAEYRRHMRRFAAMPVLQVARWQIHRLATIDPMPAILAQAARSTPARTLKSLTEPAGAAPSRRRFKSVPPLLTPLDTKTRQTIFAALPAYAQTLTPERAHLLSLYTPIDAAFKVVGTGSIGLRDYVLYLEGTHAGHSDPLFLQIKEEAASAYAPYLPASARLWQHNGHRVMDGQRSMQLTSDPFLGYTTIRDRKGKPRDYLVRQLNDHKASLDLTTLTAESLCAYASLCGELFARGHARSGDPIAIAAYLGSSARFDDALLTFAHAYADRTEQVFEQFKGAVKAKAKSTLATT